jgi:kynurenine--oxoglutarate transaminase/cysteine-S-conjugate beta-lyase/glutamine--phenylpyruvate transaminase
MVYCRIEFSALAVAHKAINVGQGFIDYEAPRYLIDFYKEALDDPNILLHQYTRGFVSFVDLSLNYNNKFFP